MSEIKTGGPAFPAEEDVVYPSCIVTTKHQGMTLRDYFAAKAMQGWVASAPQIMGEKLDGSTEMANVVTRAAYTMADSMLEARK